jgi:SHS2 domain-containing protein
MPWRFLDDRATADVSFHSSGESLDELFRSSVDAVISTMLPDLSALVPRERRRITITAKDIEALLFDLLQEVIYRKDAEGILLRLDAALFSLNAESITLEASLRGERIDRGRHELRVDVKGVSLYRYYVGKTPDGWETEVLLDV